MNYSKVIRFSLRLWGEKINHKLITNTLGFEPSYSYERGHVKQLSSGKMTAPKDLGIWVFEKTVDSTFENELDFVLKNIAGKKLNKIESVQIAILDIYLGVSDDNSMLLDSYECRIDNASLSRLSELGVDLRITVS